MNLQFAQRLAERIRGVLEPYCDAIEIAGSIRRQRPVCGDLDIVVLTKPGRFSDLIERCAVNGRCVKAGQQYRVFNLPIQQGHVMSEDVQLDLWFAHRGEKDLVGQETPGNFASLLVCRTGSAEFNIWLARTAQAKGLHWNPHAGLMHPSGRAFVDGRGEDGKKFGGVVTIGEYLDTPTEEAFFAALGLEFIRPEDRER
jgi:DNA polymerase/3'-5' exonuclease PolX